MKRFDQAETVLGWFIVAVVLAIIAALIVWATGASASSGWYVTAYCLRGTTATGTQAGPGSVAVDPRVIPLGSKVYTPRYGWGKAVDTGSAVRGSHIDVWIGSCGQALRFTHYGPVRWSR